MPLSTGKGGIFMKKKSITRSKDIRVFTNIRALCAAALLAALCVVISYICKAFTVTMSVRITFENLPLILSGYILGPWVGLLTGLCADLVSTAATYGVGGINPILTLGAAFIGFMSGMFSHYVMPKKSVLQIFITVFSAHIIGNMIIKTAGLYIYYRTSPVEIGIRILVYFGIATAEALLLTVILKSKGITKAIGALKL